MSPSFMGTSIRVVLGARRQLQDGLDVLEQPGPRVTADDEEDDEPDEQPGRSGVAGAGVRDQREHPDRRR